MEHDIFFSIAQTPDAAGILPDEATMYEAFFDQLDHADRLGFGVAWVAQAHLSTEIQKRNAKPVVPHWEGEVGLCTDFPQLATTMFARTERIEVGCAVVSILASGGPIALAERFASTLMLRTLSPDRRRLHIGFSAGRFEFMARPYGIVPRDPVEEAAWPALRGQIFLEAAEIFLRLLRGDVLSSQDLRSTSLSRSSFRDDDSWAHVQEVTMRHRSLESPPEEVAIDRRYAFEDLRIVPNSFDRDLMVLTIGSHDPNAQRFANTLLPVKVFNLSITAPEVIEATHERMREAYHPEGGAWHRGDMPRTVFVFLNEEEGLTPEERCAAARLEAEAALAAYWRALDGTLDPAKVERAADNALIGDAPTIAATMIERFHPDDRIMAWFDFFNHDSERVKRNMTAYMERVVPLVEAGVGQR